LEESITAVSVLGIEIANDSPSVFGLDETARRPPAAPCHRRYYARAAGRYFVCSCRCRRSIARAICSCSSAIFVKPCSRKRFALARCHFADFSSPGFSGLSTSAALELLVVPATSDRDFEAAFASIVQHRAGVLLISTDPFLFQSADRLIALAARDRIPAVYNSGESVAGGGLISYGASISDAWRLAGAYAGRILKGARPAELPVVHRPSSSW
jgi:ABC transporter substrate binding protein